MAEPDLFIAPTLADLLPPLTDEEKATLEENIISDGRVTDPILYAGIDGRNTVLDGMHRLPIAKSKAIPYRAELVAGITTLDEAKVWVIRHQLGRRNLLNPLAQRNLLGELYNLLKGKHGGDRTAILRTPSSGPASSQIDNLQGNNGGGGTIAASIASDAGVSPGKVLRAGAWSANLESIAESLREPIRTGKLKISESDLATLAKLDAPKQVIIARDVRMGHVPSWAAAFEKHGVKPSKPKPQARAEHDSMHYVAAMGKLPAAMREAIESGTHPASEALVFLLAGKDRKLVQKVWADVYEGRHQTIEAAAEARGICRATKQEKPSPLDNIPKALHARIAELKPGQGELERLSEFNMDEQREIMKLVDGKAHNTIASAIGAWDKTPATDEAKAKRLDARAHLGGMAKTIDTLRVRIDEIVAELGGRPTPDYAQQALDSLDVARIALAKWARKA